MSKRISGYTALYAIIRIDNNLNADIQDRVTVTKIVADHLTAEKEISRLNALNGGKGCKYFWQSTRAHFALEERFLHEGTSEEVQVGETPKELSTD